MDLTYSFKFANIELNHKLISLVKKASIKHFIDKDRVVHYSPQDEEVVENELIGPIRDQVFSPWQVLTCPKDWIERYKRYMRKHGIPYSEELSNDEVWFLIPRRHRPNLWKLTGDSGG